MMSVKDIRAKRLQNRTPPPGFKSAILNNDGNNNAKKQKKKGILSFSSTVTALKNFFSAKTSRKSKEPDQLSTSPVPEQEKTYIDTVGGEKVIVNRPDDSDEAEKEIEINNTQTPEDYRNTYDFYFHINENRKDTLKVIHRLGEMLIFRDLEGDIDEWAIFVEKADLETAEWKKRCRKSNEYYEKTGRVLAVDEKTLKYKIQKLISRKTDEWSNYLSRVLIKAKEVCPCFGQACPCLIPAEVGRVRSIYSESWHWDEPVPD